MKLARITGMLLSTVLLTTCSGDTSGGPSSGPVMGTVAVAPVFPSGGFFGANLPLDHIHAVVARPPSTTLKDTTLGFDVNLDRLRLTLPVLLKATAESLDVTLELLSGTQVLFSGTQRLEAHAGPPSSTPPPPIPLVYIGPGSQVAALFLAPVDSLLTQGDNLPMRITAQDANQLPVSAFYVSWSSADTAIAKVNGAGVVHGLAASGQVYIRARTPATVSFPQGVVESTSVFLQPAGGVGMETWTGAVSADWNVAGNWNPAILPSGTDSVVIPAATNHPTLSTSVVVGAVNVAGGVLELNGQVMVVARGFATSGNGILLMTNPADALSVQGDAVFNGGNELGSMSAGILAVNGDLIQQNSNSDDSFHPSGSHITELTGSTPSVFFASPGNVPGSSHFQELAWLPTGAAVMTLGSNVFAHGVFTAPTAGTVTGGHPLSVGGVLSTSTLTFDNVQVVVNQAGGLPLIADNLTFTNQPTTAVQLQINHPGVGSPYTLSNLTFTTTPTTGFYLGVTDLNPTDGQVLTLDLANPVPATPGAFVQTSGGAVVNWPIPAPPATRTWTGSISADWSDGSNWSPAGAPNATDTVVVGAAGNLPLLSGNVSVATLSVTGTGGNVTLNGHTLDIAGDLVVTSNAQFTMTNAADQVTVAGNATFQGGDETGLLSAGTLTVRGNFAQNNGNANAFAASGTQVVLNGTSQQTVSFGFPGSGNSRFQNLTVTNPAGIKFLSNTVVGGNLTVTGATPLTDNGGQMLTVLGTLTTSAGSSVTLSDFVTPTAPVIGGSYSVGTTTYTGTLAIPSLGYTNLVIAGAITVPADFGTLGNLTVTGGGNFVVNGHSISIGGALLAVNGSLLTMTNAADQVTVFGLANLQGGDETGLLTAGTLTVKGDFFQGNPNGFAATGTAVVLNGTAQQMVFFGVPGAGQSHFQTLTVNNPAGVKFNSNVVVMGAFNLNGATPLTDNGVQTLTVLGTLSTAAGSSVTLTGFTTATAPVIGGTYSVGTTTYTGTGMSFPVLPYTNVVLTGDGSPAGNLTLTGGLTVTNTGANFTVGGRTLAVSGGLVVTNGALVTMTNPADQLQVFGAATFQGGDETGHLTAGTIILNGDFAQHNGNANAFAASGTLVVLNGTSQQGVIFDFPGSGNSRFQNLTVNNPAGIQFNTNAFINGTLTANGPTPITHGGGFTLTVAGVLSTVAGSSVTLNGLTTATAPVIVGTYSVGTTTYTGTGMSFPVLPYANVAVLGDGSPAGNLTLTGSLTVNSSGNFTVGGRTLTIGTDLLVTNAALLTMTNAADQVTVAGNATFQGGDETGLLSAGTLTVKGNFAQHNGNANAFAASGTAVVLNGTSQQTVIFDFPGSGNSRFQNLTINNPAGIKLTSNGFVNGSLTVNGATPLTDNGGQTLTVAGPLTTAAGSSVTLNGFTTATAPVIGGSYSVGTTTFTGTGMSFPVLPYTNVVVIGDGSPAGNLTLTGSLTVTNSGANFAVGGRTLTIGTDLLVTNAALLTMTNAADQVTVAGNAAFQGGDETGLLSAGTLTVKGNFAQHNGNANAFAASGSAVVLNGTSQQAVQFDFPGSGNSRFQNLTVTNPAGIKFTSNTVVNGNLTVIGTTPLTDNGAQTLTVLGTLSTAAGSSVTLTNFTTAKAPVIGGSYSVGTTTYTGTGMSFPVLAYTNLVLTGDGAPAGNLTLTGSLTVTNTGANFTVGGRTLTIGADLVVTSNAQFTMTSVNDQLTVAGNATFQGGDETGLLSAGTLTVKGNFAQNNGNANAFAASGTHKVILNGASTQTVSFGFPSLANSHFQTLDVSQAAGGVFVNSNVFVKLQLISQPGAAAPPKISSGGFVLTTVSGSMNKLILDNTQLVVDEQGTSHAQQLDSLIFQGFPTTATAAILLNITAVGGAAAPRTITVNSTTVQTSLGIGGLYVKATSNGFGLNIIMNGSNDLNGGPARSQAFSGATVIWQ